MAQKKILFIDADDAFVRQLTDTAQGAGFGTIATASSVDGVDLAKAERPDLIVVSVELSPTNGWSVCTKLKKDDDLKGIPVVLTSSTSTQDTFEKHKKLKTRAEEYLLKPFGPEELLRVAGELVGLPDPPVAEEDLVVEDETLSLGDFQDGADESIAVADDEPLATPSEDALDELGKLGGLDDVASLDDETTVAADEPLEEAVDPLATVEGEADLAVDTAPPAAPSDALDELDAFDKSFDSITPGEELGAAAPGEDQLLEALDAPPPAPAEEEEALAFEDAPVEGLDVEPVAAAIDEPVPEAPPADDVSFDEVPPADFGSALGSAEDAARVSELENRVAELEAELEGFRATESSRDEEITRLQQENSRRDREILDARSQLHEKDKQILELRESEQAKSGEVTKAKSEIARAAATQKALATKAEQVGAAYKKLEKDLAAAREEAKAGVALKAKVAQLEAAAVAAGETASETAVELASLREQVAAGTQQAEEAKVAREAVDAEIAQVRADLEAARAETEAARAETETVRAELETVRAEAEAARADLETARAEAETLRAEGDVLRTEADALRAEVEEAKTSGAAALEKTAAADQRATEAEGRAVLAEDQVRTTREGLQRLLEQIGEAAAS